MKRIDFIFIGRAKASACDTLERYYHDKIIRYVESGVTHLKDSAEKNVALKCEKESQTVLAKLAPSDWLILCDEHGKSFTSIAFSEKLIRLQGVNQRIVFTVGGAFGVSTVLKARANMTLGLSDFTLPHELSRVLLLEQVYRALTIQNREKYHHESFGRNAIAACTKPSHLRTLY